MQSQKAKGYKTWKADKRTRDLVREMAKSGRANVVSGNRLIMYKAPAVKLGEIKSLDESSLSQTLSATAQIYPLNLIRAGSSFFNRIGRKINLKSCHLKLYIVPIRTTAFPSYVRVMLVYDSQTNGALPAISDIIQDTDQGGGNTTDATSSANLNNRDRFKILTDWRIVLPSSTYTAGVITNPGFIDPVSTTFDLERYVKLKGLITQYKADSSPAVIGDIATGGLYLVTYGDAGAGNEGYRVEGSARLRYYDS
nr:capsid protein [Cressdnaviricota sp.]